MPRIHELLLLATNSRIIFFVKLISLKKYFLKNHNILIFKHLNILICEFVAFLNS